MSGLSRTVDRRIRAPEFESAPGPVREQPTRVLGETLSRVNAKRLCQPAAEHARQRMLTFDLLALRLTKPVVLQCFVSEPWFPSTPVKLGREQFDLHVWPMTLLITVANSRGVHQSSDYRLSDAGRPDREWCQAGYSSGQDWAAQISFTGVARDGRGYDTREWLRDTLVAAGTDATLDEVVAAIVGRGNSALATVQSHDRRLSVVVGAVVGGRSRLFLVSNWESPSAAPTALPRPTLEANEIDLGRPRLFVNGFAQARCRLGLESGSFGFRLTVLRPRVCGMQSPGPIAWLRPTAFHISAMSVGCKA